MLGLLAQILGLVINLYIVVLWARLILEYVQLFARNWKPKGVVLVLCEFVYSITDPPVKLVRKVVPPLRVGNISIDLAWMIVMFALIILANALVFLR
ncbi:YggT family protein [Pseudoclavibacter chungangensis]|uniref:YggT family protein n=1 Tax=Pseudoclavibacter chungangensis TaxID=587635 RepID=A0A7J5C065_9MICO|nr:YggT family protein [Pseudoclavibacter chungangensis]KAB1660114.1 YggT family protein [Pseudoclavibacter chungangensis]NYJ66781.1 YggT family protein [Pseudoclavibacter chungangensis]